VDCSKAKKFLSEVLADLPQNCFFDKQVCGCGETHLALTNSIPYVIVVLFVEAIRSKISQYENEDVYPVCAKMNEYMGSIRNKPPTLKKAIKFGTKKFLVTYVSLVHLTKALGEKTKDFQLLVDEAHMLTDVHGKNYMHHAIRGVLNVYKQFKSVCFTTSTSYERES
jgi:hypothetical protein